METLLQILLPPTSLATNIVYITSFMTFWCHRRLSFSSMQYVLPIILRVMKYDIFGNTYVILLLSWKENMSGEVFHMKEFYTTSNLHTQKMVAILILDFGRICLRERQGPPESEAGQQRIIFFKGHKGTALHSRSVPLECFNLKFTPLILFLKTCWVHTDTSG